MVGIYNVVWSGSNAIAYCLGGWLWERFGRNGLYWIPISIMAAQFILTLWLERVARHVPKPIKPVEPVHHPEAAALKQKIPPQTLPANGVGRESIFLCCHQHRVRRDSATGRAVPPDAHAKRRVLFAVVLRAHGRVHPAVAMDRVALPVCAGWWPRFVSLIVGFAALLLAPQFWVVIAAQVVFGVATGLIYYSSLFYSMDAGDAKGEHGGFLHEAMIGAGICGGPLIGATALSYAPNAPNAGVYAVTALLVAGFGGLIWLRMRKVS